VSVARVLLRYLNAVHTHSKKTAAFRHLTLPRRQLFKAAMSRVYGLHYASWQPPWVSGTGGLDLGQSNVCREKVHDVLTTCSECRRVGTPNHTLAFLGNAQHILISTRLPPTQLYRQTHVLSHGLRIHQCHVVRQIGHASRSLWQPSIFPNLPWRVGPPSRPWAQAKRLSSPRHDASAGLR
jgi:hypothetical protein